MKPQIVMPEAGFHNADLEAAKVRLMKGNTYRKVSTVCFIPSRGTIHMKVALSHENMLKPMNQMYTKVPILGMEVGQAYEAMVDTLRGNPGLRDWPYVLTLEDDNIPPPDGLLKLIEDIESGPWDAVGGLYWTKGPGGQPMCYGRPESSPRDYVPFLPDAGTVAQCNGLGMGFTLFRIKMLLDERFTRPMFKTVQEYTPGVGCKQFTQDLWFFEQASKLGYRFACSTRVLVGHYDQNEDQTW